MRKGERGTFDLVWDALPLEREFVLRTYPMFGIPLAFLVAGGVTAVIFFGWLLMLPIRFADENENAVSAPAAQEQEAAREVSQNAAAGVEQSTDGEGFFSGMWDGLKNVVSGAGSVFDSLTPFSSLFDGATFFVKNQNDGNFPTVSPPVFNASETESSAAESGN